VWGYSNQFRMGTMQGKQSITKTPDWGMFNLAPRCKNRAISGSLHYLQSAGFVGTLIVIQTHLSNSKIDVANDFPALFAPSLSRDLQNIPQNLRHTLR
jgi:hypothetical protein